MMMNTSFIHPHSSTTTKTGTKTGTKIGTKPGNDPTYPSQSQAKHLDQIPLERSTQQVFGPCKDLPNVHQNVSCNHANLAKPGKFNAMQIVMSVLFVAITYFLANVYIDNHVHRQLAFLNRYRVEHTRMNTTVNVAIHYTMDLNELKMELNEDILNSVASFILKFKSLRLTSLRLTEPGESSTEQKLTTFDLGKFLEAEPAAVDKDRKQSTKVAGAEAVSGDLYLIF